MVVCCLIYSPGIPLYTDDLVVNQSEVSLDQHNLPLTNQKLCQTHHCPIHLTLSSYCSGLDMDYTWETCQGLDRGKPVFVPLSWIMLWESTNMQLNASTVLHHSLRVDISSDCSSDYDTGHDCSHLIAS